MNTGNQFFEGAKPITGQESKVLRKTIRRTAKESVELITVEALEKEPGWELQYEDHGSKDFGKGLIYVGFTCGEVLEMKVGDQNINIVSTMQELRTLEVYVNGPQK